MIIMTKVILIRYLENIWKNILSDQQYDFFRMFELELLKLNFRNEMNNLKIDNSYKYKNLWL